MTTPKAKPCSPDASVCTALAVGDIIVACAVWVVIVLLLLMVLGTLFFRFLWRPLRLRQFLHERQEANKRGLIDEGRSEEDVRNYKQQPVHLTYAQHKHLHMDEETSKYSIRARNEKLRAMETAKSGETGESGESGES